MYNIIYNRVGKNHLTYQSSLMKILKFVFKIMKQKTFKIADKRKNRNLVQQSYCLFFNTTKHSNFPLIKNQKFGGRNLKKSTVVSILSPLFNHHFVFGIFDK